VLAAEIGTQASLAGASVAPETLIKRAWTHVIVGGGSAGCVLAHRLSEDETRDVLLVEAGGPVQDPAVDSPTAWPTLSGGLFDWGYQSTPQTGLAGRSVPQPRGKGLGGSSLINALAYQRGPHHAYDRWAEETGDQRWSFAQMLPRFRRMETASPGGDQWRGDSGPLHALHLGYVKDQNPLSVAFLAAGIEAGHSFNADWNGESAEGAVWNQLTIHNGRRDSAARAFLEPIVGRRNLSVLSFAQVVQLKFAGVRCTGVEIAASGGRLTIPASEVILAAGAFDSPKLLMFSGIGDPQDRKRAGVPVVHALPGVGRALHDHPLMAGLLFRAKRPIPASFYNHGETMVVAGSSRSPGWADIQLMGLSVPLLLPHIGDPPERGFSVVPTVLNPISRGRVMLTTNDPREPLLIDPAYLGEQADTDKMVEAVQLAREVANGGELRDWMAEEVFPGPKIRNHAELTAYVRNSTAPFYHPVSTCRMGRANDSMAVVDTDCRVHGLTNLRVVDASIFPSIPQAMTNAATIAVAERASDIILGRDERN
jgi:choline dehydrogenase